MHAKCAFAVACKDHEDKDVIQYSGIALLILWAVNIIAWMRVLEARPGLTKLLIWTAVLLVPLLGFVAWYLFGPRPKPS